MKTVSLGLLLTLLVISAPLAAQKRQTYTGEIMDGTCAMMGGSHDAMTSKNPKLTMKTCTLTCVKGGAKFVLYDADTHTVYQLDDQKKPEHFAGAKVEVTGTLDDVTKTIHVASIKMQESSQHHSSGW